MPDAAQIAPASGKLGVLTPGMGAVATTLYAGVLAARKGLAEPFGSLTQLGHIRLGRRDDNRNPLIRDFVPLASMDDLVFGGSVLGRCVCLCHEGRRSSARPPRVDRR